MHEWDSTPPLPPRALRFTVGEVAIYVGEPLYPYKHTPVEVLELGPFKCGRCPYIHDYSVKLCDGTTCLVDDPDLKKFEPPADEAEETESEELDLEVSA